MRRIQGATAVFLEWLCLPLSVVSSLIKSQFMGPTHREGARPPTTVFGIAGVIFLWLVIGTSLLTTVPVLRATYATDPSRPLYLAGAILAIGALVLFLADPRRAHGVLLPSGALFIADGWLMAGAAKDPPAWEGTDGSAPAGEFERGPEVQDRAELPSGTEALESPTRPVAEAEAPKPEDASCPWCSARIPASATTCPECRATVSRGLAADHVLIPGLTLVPPELEAYLARSRSKAERKSLLSRVFGSDSPNPSIAVEPSSLDALRAPSAEVRAEMARIDRETGGAVASDPWLAEPIPVPAVEAVADEAPDAADASPGAIDSLAAERPARPRRARRPRA